MVKGCPVGTDGVLCRRHLYAFNRYNLLHPEARISVEEFVRGDGKYKTKRKRYACAVFGCINRITQGLMCEYHFEKFTKYKERYPGVAVDVQRYMRSGVLRKEK